MQFLNTKCCAFLVRAQNTNLVIGLHLLHKKSLFESGNSHTGPLFRDSKFLSPLMKTAFDNCIFISKSLEGLLQLNLAASSNFHLCYFHYTRWANLGYLQISYYQTKN